MNVIDLRCEYARNPLGIEARAPRFSWMLEDNRRGQTQTAYQILVASDPAKLAEGRADKWDSGKVLSTEQVSILYNGATLVSRERCYWQARAWDGEGAPTGWSEVASFELGLLDPSDWQSLWLGHPAGFNGQGLYFRAFFNLDKPVARVARARAYVAGLGLYEFYVNGVKATDHVLEPAQTDYASRVLYTTIDIGALLREGRNIAGAIVGNGWHGAPKLRAQIHIDFTDGTSVVYAAQNTGMGGGTSWMVGTGPIVANAIYDGETYDARLERAGWCDPAVEPISGYNRKEFWVVAVPVDAPAGRMQAQPLEPMRVVQTLTPVAIREPAPHVHVADMGQNMVGWVRLRVQGARGTTVTLRFAENLNDDGTVDQGNLRSAACTDVYICKGAGVEEWAPRFTYHGFRYVQMEGYPGAPGLEALLGCVAHSDVATRGQFECSDDLLNRMQRAAVWTETGNLHGLPTDCPQRDERMGWLNDMTVRAEAAHYNCDLNRLHGKWIADIHDGQDARGAIPDTAPYRMGSRPADPVTMCYLLAPWLLYQHYGNTAVMAEHYEGFKAWVDYLTTRSSDGILPFSYYGDWSPPIAEATVRDGGPTPISAHTPGALMSTGYYYFGSKLLSQMAAILGKRDDAFAYGALASRIRGAYQQAFWDDVKRVYGSGNQACCAFTLYMGLATEEQQAAVFDALVRDVEAHDDHLTTGNLCSKYLLEVLSAHGRHDLAYRIATQTTYPSWGFMLANGATTIWERWENSKDTSMHSKNHPMMSTFSAWFYRYLAGIQVMPNTVGFNHFAVKPHLVDAPEMTHASASLETVHGRIESAWQRDGDALRLHVRVPVNTTARISVPIPGTRADSDAIIRESGQLLWDKGQITVPIDGITTAEEDGAWVTFTAGSGEYDFVAANCTRS